MGILDFLFRRARPNVGPAATLPAAPVIVVDQQAARREQRDLHWRRAIQDIKHPFDLVPGAQAEAAFLAAQAQGRTKGFSPLILQPGFDGPVLSDPNTLKGSKVRTADEYFTWRTQTMADDTDHLALFDRVDEVEPQAAQGLYMVDMLSAARPLSTYAEVAIVRLPCKESWKIPLFVPVGGPADQSQRSAGEEIGIQKDWHDSFGAELCCVGERSWQFRVARPPRDHDEAVELLRQHYLYAWLDGTYDEDSIEQGVASLRVSPYWMFFWQ